jgi:DNA-binding NarL/FixJ family response regulator
MTAVQHEVDTQVVTLMLVDAMPVVRGGLRVALAHEEGITVVAEAATGRDALVEATRHQPDVLVADLPTAELTALCREVQRFGTAVLAFTDDHDDVSVTSAIRAGVRGYLPKSAAADDLIRAIRSVAGGQAIFGAHVAGKVTELLFARPAPPFTELTPREREVLDLIAVGLSNSAIAHRLNVTTKTVRNHTSGIFAKLGVAGRAGAIALARGAGLGQQITDR